MNHILKSPVRPALALGLFGALTIGCTDPAERTETQEIIENLVEAGFPADDIQVVDGVVYVGRDAAVTLAASREMLETQGTSEEQYRTNNLVGSAVTKICINAPGFTGMFSTALDLAIQNYNDRPLSFRMVRAPSTGCSATINATINPSQNGGSAGFPSGGMPYGQIIIGGLLSNYGVDVIEHVITHELGHAIGFRHSDYYNRAISCGTGGNEGDAGIGAVLIPGTPSTANVGGSIMNSCFRSVETGEFTGTDLVALNALYGVPSAASWGWSSVSNVKLDGVDNVTSVPAGAPVPLSTQFFIDAGAAGCPGCITQMVFGVSGGGSKSCVYSGVGVVNSSAGGVLIAPATPGIYDVWATHAWQYTCNDAMNVSNGGARVGIIHVY